MTNKQTKTNRIAVVGLGYVGLPLAMLFADKGFDVLGVDVDVRKIKALKNGESYLPDISDQSLQNMIATGKFRFSDHFASIRDSEAVLICVPTPLTAYQTPDLQYLQAAAQEIGKYVQEGQLIVLESSTFPGTTREVLTPTLEQASGLTAGTDFYVGYSPERIDPGNRQFQVEQIPKVTSGLTPACTALTNDLYARVFEKTVPVSSPETAEMTKLLENAQRFVNISFMNEMAFLCEEMQIDIWEVIESAATKPFGFTPYYPGPGIGGHCIPVDPLYLQWKAQRFGLVSKFIDISNEYNQALPVRLAHKTMSLLSGIPRPKILLYGVAYKKDINDTRESSAYELIHLLSGHGAQISYHDPFIPEIEVGGIPLSSVDLTDDLLRSQHCIIIYTDHSEIPIQRIVSEARLVFDMRNATAKLGFKPNVIRLGSGAGPAEYSAS